MKKISVILLLSLGLLGRSGCNNSATEERVELNDDNINNYITVKQSGEFINRSTSALSSTGEVYNSYKVETSIAPSISGSICENVSFTLRTTLRYRPWVRGSDATYTFREEVTLDNGCNSNITSTGKPNIGGPNTSNMDYIEYEIEDVTGTINIK